MSDKRHGKRRIKRLSVTFTDGTEEHHGFTSDFSMSGLFIRTRKMVKDGTPLRVVLDLGNGKQISLNGIVARHVKLNMMIVKDGVGVHFDDPPQEYRDFITGLLS